jgi:hypothetical protein
LTANRRWGGQHAGAGVLARKQRSARLRMAHRARGCETRTGENPWGRRTMPYVRVALLSFDPARLEEIQRSNTERSLPRIRQLPGFRRYTGAGDRATGKGLVMVEFDTQEQAQGMVAELGSEWSRQIADLGVKREAEYVYEVVTQI